MAFFAVCGLDVLDTLDVLSETRRREICDWIYRHQVVSDESSEYECSGFQGSATLNVLNSDPKTCGTKNYKWGHLAMTYTGIAMLLTLGDDLSRLNRKAIVAGVAAVQRPDGSFSASVEGNEHDMRFVYCASAICFMLNDWGKVDKELMADYIKSSIVSFFHRFFAYGSLFSLFLVLLHSQRYDYGVSQHCEGESHGGTTFCAIAALQLSDQLEILSESAQDKLIRWLVLRQVSNE